mgnify:CR=1 FL=1
MKTIDLKRMLKDINKLVETDFCESMCDNSNLQYTQEQSKKMAKIIGQVYSIAHCTHCKACQQKYIIKTNEQGEQLV